MSRRYPLLASLEARGDFAREGPPLACIRVEVRGQTLIVSGRTPLEDDGVTFVRNGDEYCYILEGSQAEALLAALTRRSDELPERTIAQCFEFTRPGETLAVYLDSQNIMYTYYITEGELL